MKIKRVIRRLWAWSFPTLVTTMFLFTVARTVVFAQLSPGDILVVDQVDPFRTVLGGLFRVDPVSGNRTLFSDITNAAQGPFGVDPHGMAVEASGDILVVDPGGGGGGGLFRVDPVSGNWSLLSDFGNAAQGPLGEDPSGVAVEASGDILVTDDDVGEVVLGESDSGRGGLFRVDPVSGNRTLLSDFSNAAQGPLGITPLGVAIEASGDILVVDFRADGNKGALFRVDPVSGDRTLLSDFGNAAQGPLRAGPFGVAVFFGPVLQRINTVLVANFVNGNTDFFKSRVYLWNPSVNAGNVSVRVFTLEQTGSSTLLGMVDLGSLGSRSALNLRLEDILAALFISTPYEIDNGNLTLEFTIGAEGLRGAAQVFNNSLTLAFGTYPLQAVPSTSAGSPTVLVANFLNGNTDFFRSRIYLFNPSASDGPVTVRVYTLPRTDGTAEELTNGPLPLTTLAARSALNLRLEDILDELLIPRPYETDAGNLILEFTIGAADVIGAAQVFNNSLTLAFGTYPLQVIP